MSTIRTFVAIEITPKIKTLIRDIQLPLKKLPSDVKWVDPDIAHITLRFLGDVLIEKIDEIHDAIKTILSAYPPFMLQTTAVGAFPSMRNPRVIWIGLNDPLNQSQNIVTQLNLLLEEMGFPPEKDKKFFPHITIGRIRSSKNIRPLVHALESRPVPETIALPVATITLFKSTLTSKEPIHAPIKKISLTG